MSGPKGIGKTTTFKNIVFTIPLIFPDIIAIYIDYDNITENKYLQQKNIIQIIADQLSRVYGMKLDTYHNNLELAIVKALIAYNKYILLIVDELDKLNEISWENEWSKTLVSTLGGLCGIANDDTGRFSAFLSGSSSQLMSLVTADGKTDEECVKRFPLVSYAPDLNNTKFKQYRIYAAPPIDLNTVSKVLYGKDVTEGNIAKVRAITYFTGSVTREIVRLQYLTKDDFSRQYSLNSASNSFSSSHTKAYPIWKEILDLLFEKNKYLIEKQLLNNGSIDLKKVMEVDWENKFQSLCFSELCDSWKKRGGELGSLGYWVFYLYDYNLIMVDDGQPDLFYPYSLHMLTCHKMDQNSKASMLSKIYEDCLKPIIVSVATDFVKDAVKSKP